MRLLRRDCLILMAGTVPLAADPVRPDLSGRWKMDLGRSELGRKMRVGGYYEELMIQHREPLVTIDYRLRFEGRFSGALYKLRTDSSEVRTETPAGPEISRTHWENERLVTIAMLVGSDTAGQRIARFLSKDGKTLNVQYGNYKRPKTLIFVPF